MKRPRRIVCIQKDCGKSFTAVIAEKIWNFHNGAICLPCEFAGQLQRNGQTPDQIHTTPQLGEYMESFLRQMGWRWADLEDSFTRVKVQL